MANQHKIKGTTVRPEPAEVEAAKPHLDGRSIETLLRATLRALKAEPDRVLATLEPYWPPEKPRGRPRKTPPTDAGE
jgi:hypothetical protein